MTASVHRAPVLVVDLAEGFGGAERRVIDTAIGLGPELTRVAVLAGSPLEHRARQAGLAVSSLERSKSDPRLVMALRRLIRETGPRVVDAHNVQSQLWGHLAARAEGVPVMVSTVHSEYRLENPGTKGKTHDLVLRRNARWGCRFVAVSRRIESYLRATTGKETAVSLIRRGFPVAVGSPSEPIDRESLGWSDDDLVLGVVGRLVHAKGHEVLFEAVARLNRGRGPRVCLYVVGDGPRKDRLVESARAFGLGDRVRFAGFTDDVPAVLALIDFLCLPSHTEGLPNVVLEAASVDVPLILTRVGEVPALFVDGRDALLADPGDIASLSATIDRAVGLGDAGASMARSAQVTLERELGHDWVGATRAAYGI